MNVIKRGIGIVSGSLALIAIGVGTVFAQQYYPFSNYYSTYQTPYTSACVNITHDLSFGMRGSNVTQLQSFLVSRNYPGSGSWMITGYFGAATQAAVRNFQQENGLPQTGALDSATRSAIYRSSCGGTMPYQQSYLYNNNYNYTIPWNSYNYNYNYSYPSDTYPYVSLNLTSLSQNTGAPGTIVTVYGTGFDAMNNTVYFGGQQAGTYPSSGGSITFAVPQYYYAGINTTAQIKVANWRGTSNPLDFTVTYPYGQTGCGTYTYPYNYYNQYSCAYPMPINNTTSPSILYINPIGGTVGANVSIYGNGFTTTGNTVHFGVGIIANLNSPDGRSVSFTVPTQLTGYGTQLVGLGAYNVSVTNALGITSNAQTFTVTSLQH